METKEYDIKPNERVQPLTGWVQKVMTKHKEDTCSFNVFPYTDEQKQEAIGMLRMNFKSVELSENGNSLTVTK